MAVKRDHSFSRKKAPQSVPNTQSTSCSLALLLCAGLDSGLGDLAASLVSLDDGLDDTHGNL